MSVKPNVPERALVHRLLGYLRCRDAGDIFAVVKDRLRWLHVIAREEASSASRRRARRFD